jgi:cyclic-di-GMP phosphodiesterase, flagellum assembly factor TipF
MMLPPADLLIPATAQTIAVSTPPAETAPRQSDKVPPAAARSEPAPWRLPETRIPEAQPLAAQVAAQTVTKAPAVIDSRVAEIAKAIEAKNMDVLLSPIVGLGDYAVTHFEVVVRLRGTDGTLFERPEEALTLAGNHLLALFDAERLSRTAAVAELLESRGKAGSVMTATSGSSIGDSDFLATFARVYETRNSISGQLVLTFSQADVAAFGSGTWQALRDMHSFGFRFALDHVTHLGMDFENLVQSGFTFVKLPADVFLRGLPSDSGFITANDICQHLARCGLTLVVESVDDEALLARVFGFGALFGQGQLFGAPRQISLDTLAPAQSAAA